MDFLRTRNASDGDSGFDSALSSRSSSISLEESQDLLDFKVSKIVVSNRNSPLRDQFSHILQQSEDITQDVCTPDLFLIRDRVSGKETLYKPPSKISFSSEPPEVEDTYSSEEYNRCNPIPRSQLFNARLQLELEKQVAKMDLLEVDLLMDKTMVPPPSLGIRVIGVNMIHGVPDKLNIYVKKVMEGSVAGQDGRIKVTDHIVEVNGVSLVGVSQKLAAEALSNCAVNPTTGIVHFVLAREPVGAGSGGGDGATNNTSSSDNAIISKEEVTGGRSVPTVIEPPPPRTPPQPNSTSESRTTATVVDGGDNLSTEDVVVNNNKSVKSDEACNSSSSSTSSTSSCNSSSLSNSKSSLSNSSTSCSYELVGNTGESKAFIPRTREICTTQTQTGQQLSSNNPVQLSCIFDLPSD